MDLNKAAFAIGILALLLAVPLAVVANLLTPRCREWYSSQNYRRRTRRIQELKRFLNAAQNTWLFSAAEWEIYDSNYRVFRLLLYVAGFFVGMLSSALLTFAFERVRLQAKFGNNLAVVGLLLGALGLTLLVVYLGIGFFVSRESYKYNDTRRLHSLGGRAEMQMEIAKLESMNATHTGASSEART